MKYKVVVIGRVLDEHNKLIGLKVVGEDFIFRFVKLEDTSKLIMLNVKIKNNWLTSTFKGLNLIKYPRYNKKLELVNELDCYNELEIISLVLNISLYDLEYKVAGAISGAIYNPDSLEKDVKNFAENYYGLIRKMKTDVEIIARNTGYTVEQIEYVKNYLFLDKHDLGNGKYDRFDPDAAIAQSWQRLRSKNKEDILPHDIILIKHELYEARLVLVDGMSQNDAHNQTEKIYNYEYECQLYYAERRRKNGKNN